ncbi:MAG: protein phosphatase 2C domain-containing protein [Oscillospiraceae bacterium]|nr:protein phosphatase 2C domain-containing protein [Oscillospiraceae bacterium]
MENEDIRQETQPEIAGQEAASTPAQSPEAAEASLASETHAETPAEPEQPKLSDREVMQHTASIWRYRTVIEDGTELHTEFHSKLTSGNGWEVIGARARGKKHKHEGSNCDDWFETAQSEGCLIAVVADGAGSKPLSRIGARVSCEAAAEYLRKAVRELFSKQPDIREKLSADMSGADFLGACGLMAPLIQNAARAAFEAVVKKLGSISADRNYISVLGREPTLSDLSSTFLAALAVPLDGETFLLSAQIGDGCICAVDTHSDHEGCFRLLGEADSGAFSGETDFLSAKTVSEGVIARKTRISRGKSDIIMLMTDGVADDYFPAQPQMKRLVLDLQLNGIIPMPGGKSDPLPPEPLRFPSVSPDQRSVALQYSKQLLNGGETADQLWDRRGELSPWSLDSWGGFIGKRPQDRLLTWLDNYNERGSFDDRTLVVLRFDR